MAAPAAAATTSYWPEVGTTLANAILGGFGGAGEVVIKVTATYIGASILKK